MLETPASENPLTRGGEHCVHLGRVVAPFAAPGTTSVTCTVKPGTKLFIAVWTSECSNVKDPPYFGQNEHELRACARAVDAGITRHEVTLDGWPVPVTEVVSGLLKVVLPADNIVGKPAATKAKPVGHGWVALLHPLARGTHTIALRVAGEYLGAPVDLTNTTTIIVKPGRT